MVETILLYMAGSLLGIGAIFAAYVMFVMAFTKDPDKWLP